jgi:hypothetical protein
MRKRRLGMGGKLSAGLPEVESVAEGAESCQPSAISCQPLNAEEEAWNGREVECRTSGG